MDITLIAGIFYAIVFIYCVVAHELSHGLMANSLGDPTPRLAGRLTLNPIRHMDILGSVILPILTFMFAGVIIGYAKPMPYNPDNLSDRKYGSLKVALAGPFSNIALALIFGSILRFFPDIFSTQLPLELLIFIVKVNIVLAVFNMIPIPPLDGHHALETLLPPRMVALRIVLHKYSMLFLIILIWFFVPYILAFAGLLFRLITGLQF